MYVHIIIISYHHINIISLTSTFVCYVRVPIATKIATVSLSAVSCAALTDTGKVYVWGFQLGERPTLLKSLVADGMVTKQISCGATCLLMSS
jgi:hypothetical protein